MVHIMVKYIITLKFLIMLGRTKEPVTATKIRV